MAAMDYEAALMHKRLQNAERAAQAASNSEQRARLEAFVAELRGKCEQYQAAHPRPACYR